MLTLTAYAKLNLYLHVLGRRSDGYHTLESLVAFTEFGDELRFVPSEIMRLEVTGAFAREAGPGDGNLVLKAAQVLQEYSGTRAGAEITLTKNIPVGAGLGGGSADAAAVLRGLNKLWALELPTETLETIGAPLGADVPMCVRSVPAIARGTGQALSRIATMPVLFVLLVHPRIPLLTKEVYGAYHATRVEEGASTWVGNETPSPQEFIHALTATCNDLQRPAITLRPEIAEILLHLETLQPTPLLSRMTGSGACCFSLFDAKANCTRAAENLRRAHPEWWVEETVMLTQAFLL